MTLSAAPASSSFNPMVLFAIGFGVLGIAIFILHIFLRKKHETILLGLSIFAAVGFTIFLPLWANGVFTDVPKALVICTFLLGGLAFSCLLLYPYFTKTKVVSRCLLAGFFLCAIAFIVCAVFVSKNVFQPQAMQSSSSASLLSLFI